MFGSRSGGVPDAGDAVTAEHAVPEQLRPPWRTSMTYIQESVGASLPDIDELRSAVRGQVFAEGDDGYAEAARIWNGAHDGARPAVVVRCSGPADVVVALGFAREHDLEIAVRGGGHSIAGFSTGDQVAVIDLSAMNDVHVDPAARRATVGG